MRVGLIGCGFTADCYMMTLKQHPDLEIVAAADKDQQRAFEFCKYNSVPFCQDIETMLSDPNIELVVNITNSSSHYEVSKACLEAGKHLYSEKPLASTFDQAKELVELAKSRGVVFAGAPASLLGETAQTVWKALRNNAIGEVRLVYADLDDGPLHLAEPHTWHSESGAPYGYREEFEAGVTAEHAGYYLGWLAAFFGPAKTVTSFSACLWPERRISTDLTVKVTTPDFSVACVTFESGTVARLTCGLVAPYNHVMRIVGEKAILRVDECWNFDAPVYLDQYSSLRFRAERYPITKSLPFIARWLGPGPRVYEPRGKASWKARHSRYRMDYLRGVADLAEAISQKRSPRLPADFCLHITELSLAIQKSAQSPYEVETTFHPLQPLPGY